MFAKDGVKLVLLGRQLVAQLHALLVFLIESCRKCRGYVNSPFGNSVSPMRWLRLRSWTRGESLRVWQASHARRTREGLLRQIHLPTNVSLVKLFLSLPSWCRRRRSKHCSRQWPRYKFGAQRWDDHKRLSDGVNLALRHEAADHCSFSGWPSWYS